MANTSSRTLRLLSLLQAQRYWPGEVLARRLEVSVRTLRRDIDRLRELGYPVQASRGVEGGYQLAPGAALPPLVVDEDEAVALALGLQAAAQGAVSGIAEASVRALSKITQVLPPRVRRRVEALNAMTVPAPWPQHGPTVEADTLTTVAQACRDGERLQFGYTAADGRVSARHTEPHRLVALGRRWYLVAYDLDRADWRTFRLDRLTEPRSTAARFRPRPLPAPDAAAFVRAGIDTLPAPYSVEALLHAPAATARERVGRWCTIDDLGPQQCRLRMTSDSLDWPTLALGAVGADFEIISPPELRDQLQDWGSRFTRATAADQRPAPPT